MPDGAILAGRVHRLENQQHGIFVGGIKTLLQTIEPLDVIAQHLLIVILGLINRLDARGPFAQMHAFSFSHTKIIGMDFHGSTPPGQNRPVGSATVGFARFAFVARCSRLMVQRTPSMVFRQAFTASRPAGSSPSHVAQSSYARKAGMRSVGSPASRRLAGTVTSTQAKSGLASPAMS